jgi:phage terminase large subunit
MGRSKLNILKSTTLETFFEVVTKLGLKNGEDYNYNGQSNEIKFFNGSKIVLKDLFSYPSDPDFSNLGSLEIAGAFIDEANQISEKAKNMVMSRIRHKLDEFNITPKMLMTCNPAKSWVYNEFYKKAKDNELEEYKRFVPALSSDNQYITKHYKENLSRLDEISKKRLLYGEWEYADSLAIFDYDAIINMFEKTEWHPEEYQTEPTNNKNLYITIDVARLGKDKTCILIWDNLDIISIQELSKQTLDIQRDYILNIMKEYGITNKQLIIDTDGVGGGLADMFKGCHQIVNNSTPINKENYQNLKTQLYYKLADYVNNGKITIINANDDVKTRLTQELQVIKREGIDMDGKIKMTNKEQIKNMIGRSPDISDAMMFRMFVEFKPAYGKLSIMR